jgi:hypothetical protein
LPALFQKTSSLAWTSPCPTWPEPTTSACSSDFARAQVFDILTGGDPTADQDSGSFWLDPDREGEDDGGSFVPLPRQMLDDLRVNLAVSSACSVGT